MLNMRPEDVPSTSGNKAPEIDPGPYPAVITMIADLGVQRKKKFDAKSEDDTVDEHQIWISYAFPTETFTFEDDEGNEVEREQIKGRSYKVSSDSRANLQKVYSAICKNGETYADMLGKTCTVVWGPNQNGTPSIQSVAAPMKGTKVEAKTNPILVTEDDYDNLEELGVPEFIRKIIASRVNG